MFMKPKLVVKDNSLIDASFNLSLTEQRIMLLAVVNARELPDLNTEKAIEVNVIDYINQYSVTPSTAYETVKAAVDTLFNRQFSYIDKYKDNDAISKSRWVTKVIYVKASSQIILYLSSDVISLISRLESHFTKYMLDQVSDFNSKYSIRLYEIIIKWLTIGKTEKYSVSDIRSKLGVQDTEYKQFSDFKKRVIEVSVNEINKYTDIQLEIVYFKNGRNITNLQFKIKPKRNTELKNLSQQTISYKLTADQIELFGSLLADNAEFQAHYLADAGESYDQYVRKVKLKLHEEFYVESWYEFLLKVGFKTKQKYHKSI